MLYFLSYPYIILIKIKSHGANQRIQGILSWILASIPHWLACQAPLFMEFSRQEYWSGVPSRILEFPSPAELPNPGIKPRSPTLQVDSLPSEPLGKPRDTHTRILRHVEFTRSEICGWGLTPMQTIFLVFLETGVRKYLHKTFFLSYKSS